MKRSNNFTSRIVSAMFAALVLMMLFGARSTPAQTTAFTYQGRFTDASVSQPTNGTYTMSFRLFDAATGGNQVVNTTDISAMVSVVNNSFTVKLDFGATAFATTDPRYLEIQVGSTVLTPRQEITSTPFANRATNAASADALSNACVGCVTNAQIDSIAGNKVIGSVANAANATTATNISGVVGIANGGTGSTTKNFVDLTTSQTVGGNKSFSNNVSANTFNAGGGGLNMNNSMVRLRESTDSNHGIFYSPVVDGPEFRGFSGFRWTTGVNGTTERMRLNSSGNLTVTGNITANGILNGTLGSNLVGSAQITDGSLRLSDLAVNNQSLGVAGATFGPHGCLSITVPTGTIPNLAANDLVYFIPPASTPAGFTFQPVYVTGTGDFFYNVCNTANTNNTLPAQTYRIFVLRP